MSNYKRVLKHLKKEELSIQKVELALVDDLRKAESNIKRLSKEANGDGLSQVRKAVLKADRSFTDLLRASDDAIDIADKFIAAAKELGIDSKEAQGIKTLAASLQNDAEYWVKELNASQYN
jgi:EAL domain-containing protein (putative c-di-GMP-specific phosphodiesterase class I)